MGCPLGRIFLIRALLKDESGTMSDLRSSQVAPRGVINTKGNNTLADRNYTNFQGVNTTNRFSNTHYYTFNITS